MPASLRSDCPVNPSWQGGRFRPVQGVVFTGIRKLDDEPRHWTSPW